MSDLEVTFDGGRFDSRRWYVSGYASHWFSTKEDAEAAVRLAGQIEQNALRELANKILEALP